MFIIFFLLCIVLVAVIVKRTVDAVFRMECKVDQIQADIDFIVREIERLRQQSTHNAGRYPKAASRLRLHPAPVTRAGPLKRLAQEGALIETLRAVYLHRAILSNRSINWSNRPIRLEANIGAPWSIQPGAFSLVLRPQKRRGPSSN